MSDTSQQPPEAQAAPFAERFSDAFQGVLQKLLGMQRPSSPRRLKSLLNGTWLGHPLHPLLTDIPLAAWVVTAIFDLIWLIAHTAWAAPAALVTLIVGVVGALAAAVTGLTDWSDTYGAERRVGLLHAIFNTLALLLYIISGILRLVAGPDDTLVAAILGFLGLISVIYAGYLGGDMVFSKGTGVNHTAWEAGGEDYEAVMPVDEVKENTLHRVVVAGVPVVLVKQGENFFALSATCPHAGGPLDEGTLTGDQVTCPWHGSRFCLRDGRVLTGPAVVNAPRYDVRITNGQVTLKRLGEH
ncbi:MAG TPA: Rieske 2Fe-2S domain-containing protein [Ktedonobacteraceae bacterium]|nr:Rieske 2Fe-2S domain-containing protein [Ktedonobacteraceae bacterium]